MPQLDGLTLSEMVLLVAGGILFVALLIVFLWNTMNRQPVTGLLLFFVFPIVMIGFPTIQSIKIGEEGAEIDNQVSTVQANPKDEGARKALELTLNNLKGRQFNNPHTNTSIASAELALGQKDAAAQRLQEALNKDPNLESAKDLIARYNIRLRQDTAASGASNGVPPHSNYASHPENSGSNSHSHVGGSARH